ncbi:DgyrCDS7809 [Dimorphilus gyrociliatus]|uniref:Probable glutamine--tRNA ligase n=1 Tax=Dimorphilus gyrociliatus TaxID=2664684 RepID=A0A7I8VSD1_9ANNE|nr:DgyrCDS7809 [Dimorphilus gyrociliatus]
MVEERISLLKSIGLTETKAKETLQNETVTSNLISIITEAKNLSGKDGFSKQQGNILYAIGTRMKEQITKHRSMLVKYVVEDKIASDLQFTSALDFLMDNVAGTFDIKQFEEATGVGVQVTGEEIEEVVEDVLKKNHDELLEKRYQFNTGMLIREVRDRLKWADAKIVKSEIEIQLLHLLGPKTEEDLKKGKTKVKAKVVGTEKDKKPISKPASEENDTGVDSKGNVKSFSEMAGAALHFHKVGENYKTDGYTVTPEIMQRLKEHFKRINGQVRTRFPPEPNGILHIGHAKAINFNFGYAKAHNGITFLRYDDTNPEKEEERFFVGIREMVEWLGYKPYKITHSSDYFDELYNLAKVLIKKGLAYICHQTADELKGHNPPPSPWRERPIEESLALFEDMKNGKIDEGKATLRMKMIMLDSKQDPVAYRIKFSPHHRTGDKWCIYPTYDYTHCLCDSIEDITHSLCTKEFEARRPSYYWLCNAVDVYCPVQWEYGRLNVNYTVVSKRKIGKLIEHGIVRDWDDPRLFTLTALRRRGIPPEAINLFCAKVGVTVAQVSFDPIMLDVCTRNILNVTAPRAMATLNPLKVNILNFPANHPRTVKVPNFPADESKGYHNISITEVLYIEEEDFQEKDDKNFKRLTPNQPVGLRHCNFVMNVEKVKKGKDGKICELDVRITPVSETAKPKAFIQWVSDPEICQVRIYERLFKHKNPEDPREVPGGFVTDCNLDSLKIIPNAYIDKSVKSAKVYDKFQFERLGYFSVDTDSADGKLIFNLTVTLKEDSKKNP